jgi:hypothetical protein
MKKLALWGALGTVLVAFVPAASATTYFNTAGSAFHAVDGNQQQCLLKYPLVSGS